MTTDPDLLEQIVSGVMRQLTSMSGEVRSQRSDSNGQRSGSTEKSEEKTASNEFLLSENVITADLLSERSKKNTRLLIGPKSVLTPSARDWLREHKTVWHRQKQNGATLAAAAEGRWKIILDCTTPAVTAATDEGVGSAKHSWMTETADDFSAAVQAAVSAVCRAEADGVVLFTNKPAAAACRANRNRKVRASVAWGKACVQTARRQMGANLLCVHPDRRTVWELKTILREFQQAGRPIPPDDWQD